jgi:hypothetical protein
MDELMMYEYLKNKQIEDKEFLDKFKSFMGQHKSYMRSQKEYPYVSYREDYEMEDWYPTKHYPSSMESFSKEFERNNMYKYMRNNLENSHLHEEEAKHIVSKMQHIENNRKYVGEKYDMYKAKEVCQRYKGIIPTNITFLTQKTYICTPRQTQKPNHDEKKPTICTPARHRRTVGRLQGPRSDRSEIPRLGHTHRNPLLARRRR